MKNRILMLLVVLAVPLTACALRFNPLPTTGTRRQTVIVHDDDGHHHKHKKAKKYKKHKKHKKHHD